MTTVTSVAERVCDVVCETLGVNREQLTPQTNFRDDVAADSIDVVELVMALEEEFEITIPEADAARLRTVGAAIEYIEQEQGRR
jgi:acyl carrier protein